MKDFVGRNLSPESEIKSKVKTADELLRKAQSNPEFYGSIGAGNDEVFKKIKVNLRLSEVNQLEPTVIDGKKIIVTKTSSSNIYIVQKEMDMHGLTIRTREFIFVGDKVLIS